jgi:hypothetical protein
MGSGFSTYTIDEAAALLGRTPKTIRLYIKEGFLRKGLDDSSVRKEDVQSLVIEQDKALPALNKVNFFALLNRVRKLEEDMAVVRRALEIRTEPLRVKKEMALDLYNEAKLSLEKRLNEWNPEEVKTWSSLFDRFDASTFDAMPDKQRPWEIFYKLCLAMMEYVASRPDMSEEPLWANLDRGRKNLRDEAILWIELGKGTFPKEAYFGLNSEKEAILARLLAPPEIPPLD